MTDNKFLKADPLVVQTGKGMTANVVELIWPDCEDKLKGKMVPVCELLPGACRTPQPYHGSSGARRSGKKHVKKDQSTSRISG
jgi:hypothetical protein